MRVLLFIHGLTAGGAERVTASLATHWAEMGCDVIVVTLLPEARDFYRLPAQVRRYALDLAGASAGAGTAVSGNVRRIAALRRVLEREQPDGAIAMMPSANVVLALAALGTRVPVRLGSERAHPREALLGRVWHLLRWLAYPRLSYVVAQTRESAAWLHAHAGVRRDRLAVIANPVVYPLATQPPYVDLAPIRAQSGCRHLLLAVGRLDPAKGFDRLIEAFAGLAARYPDWALVIIGCGPARDDLLSLAQSHGLGPRICLPGPAGNIGDCYKAADAFALTSRAEGFPNSLLEAMAHGLPVVAVDCATGPSEIVEPEVNGLLVPQDNPAALGSALGRLLGDDALRARLARRAVRVRQTFAIAGIAQLWEGLLGVADTDPSRRGPRGQV